MEAREDSNKRRGEKEGRPIDEGWSKQTLVRSGSWDTEVCPVETKGL